MNSISFPFTFVESSSTLKENKRKQKKKKDHIFASINVDSAISVHARSHAAIRRGGDESCALVLH